MKNIEKIKNMSVQELSEYVESVFIAGRYYERTYKSNLNDLDYKMQDYTQWLISEVE